MQQIKYLFSRKRVKVIGAILLLFLLMQLTGPTVSNPPVIHPLKAPAAVTMALKKACYDCHSNEIQPDWATRVAPFSWFIAKEVNTARSRFNFSTFDTLPSAQQQGFIWEMVNMILDGKMPLATYNSTHYSSRLSTSDIELLKNYAATLNPPVYHDTAAIAAATNQYKPIPMEDNERVLPIALNGVEYASIQGFRDWQVISTTNRFDNNPSIRVVYGNSIAVDAVKKNKIKPWPEGSIVVKVVWNIIEEKNGDILPGRFNNVQMMIKDSDRFKESKGWGFAKFSGKGLEPYGNSAAFNATCFNCHKAASDYGFVFNVPLPDGETLAVNNL